MKKLCIIILLFFFATQITILLKQPLLGWDEAVYVGMAKYVASSGTIGLWEDLRPLLLPLVLSTLWKLPSNNATLILFSNMFMIIIGTFTLFMLYNVGTQLFDQKTGMLATILLAVTPVFLFSTHLIHTEILATLFVLIALSQFLHKNYGFVGIFSALAFLTKFPAGLAILAFAITRFFHPTKRAHNMGRLLCSFFLAILPFLLFNLVAYGNPFHAFITALPHQNNPTFSVIDGTLLSYAYTLFYYPFQLAKENILLIFSIPILLSHKQLKKNPLFWVLALFVLYFTIILNKQLRFSLLFLPALTLFAAQGILTIKNKNWRWLLTTLFLVAFVIQVSQMYTTLLTVNEPIMTFYTFFDNLKGPVLTANPIPAAYAHQLFIPFYQDVATSQQLYAANENIATVAYTTEFYPCKNYADITSCEEQKKELIKKISTNRNKVYAIHYGQDYLIYSR